MHLHWLSGPVPPPAPVQTFTLSVAGSSPKLCLTNLNNVSIAPCASGSDNSDSTTLWTTKNDGQAEGGIESAANGSKPNDACLMIYEKPEHLGCKGFDVLHMGKCGNAQENSFKLVPIKSSTMAGTFWLQSVQCPSRCISISTAIATASSDSDAQKAALVDCSSSTASWTRNTVD